MIIKNYIISVLCCIAMVFIIGVPIGFAMEENQLNQDNAMSYVELIKSRGFLAAVEGEIITDVDGWKITQADLTYRINEYKDAGSEANPDEIMDVLFEEATLFAQAEYLGVLPTDTEVKIYVAEAFSNKEFANFLNESTTVIPEAIEYYAFKFLAFNNVYHYYLNEGRELGLITPEWTYDKEVLNEYPYGNGDSYYFEKRIEYKASADWTSFIEFQPTVDELVLVVESNNSDDLNQILYVDELDAIDEMMAIAVFSATVNASGTGTYKGTLQNWGFVSLPYTVSYHAEEYDERIKQYLGKQDLLVMSSAVGNLPPELRSRVSGGATNYAEAFTSSGSSVDEFWSFNKNLWDDYYLYYLVWGKGSYGGLLGNSGVYYVEATGGIFIDDWVWFSGENKTVKSNNF